MNQNEIEEMIKAGIMLGKVGGAVFQGALEQTGNVEIARQIVAQYYKAMLQRDNPAFIFKK